MKGKKITIKRPLVIFDIESTGVKPQEDKIVELSIIKKHPDGTTEVKTRRINPERPIPKGASEVHGIYDKDVVDCPTFKDISKGLKAFIQGCDFVGFNSNRFDVPMLVFEFERCGIYDALDGAELIDVFNLYCHFNPRTLSAGYAEYCGKKLDAHKAEEDAKATFEILEAMLNDHNDEIEDQSVEGLAALSKRTKAIDLLGVVIESDEGPVFGIGKHKGELLLSHKSYCEWILSADFTQNTKSVIAKVLNK